MKIVAFLLAVLCLTPVLVQAGQTAVVNAIALDADTIRIGDKVLTIAGIDAPDIHQDCLIDYKQYDCGKHARSMLQKLTSLDKLSCVEVGVDSAGKHLANCSVGQDDLGTLMIEAGWALPLDPNPAPTYANALEKARTNKRGMWQGSFARPSEWKAGNQYPTFIQQ